MHTIPLSDITFAQEWLSGQESFSIPTSGSTGTPKMISVSRAQMQLSAQMTGKALGLSEGDHAFVCLSTDHIAGRMMVVRGYELGLEMTIVPPSRNPLAEVPLDFRIDFIALVPMQLQSILEESPEKLEILNRAKAIIVGGAPVSLELEQKLQVIKAPVYSTYGMTETVSHIALKRLNGSEKDDFFQVLDGVEIGLDDRKCLTIQGKLTRDELLVTNDLVKIKNQNAFRWLGRIDNVINSGGIKVQAEKVEKAIEGLLLEKGISNRFFVAGMDDNLLGKKVVVVMEGKAQLSMEELKENLSQLNRYELPKDLYFLEVFEETKTGKVSRNECLELITNQLQ